RQLSISHPKNLDRQKNPGSLGHDSQKPPSPVSSHPTPSSSTPTSTHSSQSSSSSSVSSFFPRPSPPLVILVVAIMAAIPLIIFYSQDTKPSHSANSKRKAEQTKARELTGKSTQAALLSS